ncbi:hypothetical protein Nepgr_025556 [Nepenthes gracilis]|uniref:Uncharacterized protein n=1 Tax=Nepenthes gracilis TaxID=150966 RepID=A0AAD3XZT3_NEPGR|nr:hypothetical protein Nepgr_025556 [Nepenthes gracilis]
MMQLCTPKSRFPIGPSYAEILCCGIGADPTGSLVGGEACWPISEDDRKAALGLVDAPLDPVLESPIGLDSYPPGPPNPEVDLLKTPPSISRILTKSMADPPHRFPAAVKSRRKRNPRPKTQRVNAFKGLWMVPWIGIGFLATRPIMAAKVMDVGVQLTRFMMRRPISMIGPRRWCSHRLCRVPAAILGFDSFYANAVMSRACLADDGATENAFAR